MKIPSSSLEIPQEDRQAKGSLHGTKTCRFPWKAQIPEAQAAELEPRCPPGPLRETQVQEGMGVR